MEFIKENKKYIIAGGIAISLAGYHNLIKLCRI